MRENDFDEKLAGVKKQSKNFIISKLNIGKQDLLFKVETTHTQERRRGRSENEARLKVHYRIVLKFSVNHFAIYSTTESRKSEAGYCK